MIARADIPWIVSGRRRVGRRHGARPLLVSQNPVRIWTRLWNDQQAVRFKLFLLGVCLLAAALLEVPR